MFFAAYPSRGTFRPSIGQFSDSKTQAATARLLRTLPDSGRRTRNHNLIVMPGLAQCLWLLPLLLLSAAAGVHAGGRKLSPPVTKVTFRATYETAAPDCFERPVILVNGQLSPKLEVTQGDILEVSSTGGAPSTRVPGLTCGPRRSGTARGTAALAAMPAIARPASFLTSCHPLLLMRPPSS